VEFNYKIDGISYKVIVQKKANKNTYIKVKDDLTIFVTTNYFMRKADIKDLLYKEEEFLKKTLQKVKNRNAKENEFYYLGKKYDIIMVPFNKLEIDDNKIYVKSQAELDKWLKKEMMRIFSERLEKCYNLFTEKIPFPVLKIRTMKTRWGVCNRKNLSITLNSKLIRYEMNVIDYVIIHELSHLVHFDHSKAFWNTVEKYKPDYKKYANILKE
jgi:hypothetical protein